MASSTMKIPSVAELLVDPDTLTSNESSHEKPFWPKTIKRTPKTGVVSAKDIVEGTASTDHERPFWNPVFVKPYPRSRPKKQSFTEATIVQRQMSQNGAFFQRT